MNPGIRGAKNMDTCEQSPVEATFKYLRANGVFLTFEENKLIESIAAFYRERGFISPRQQACVMKYYNLLDRVLKARAIKLDEASPDGKKNEAIEAPKSVPVAAAQGNS